MTEKYRSRRDTIRALGASAVGAPLLATAAAAQPLGFTPEAQPATPSTTRIQGWLEGPPHSRPKQIIIWGDNRNVGKGHTSTTHAMATIERLGYESGLWDSFIRTDSDMITYPPPVPPRPEGAQNAPQGAQGANRPNVILPTSNTPARGGLTLADADAIFFIGQRNIYLSDEQKAALIRFVRDEGKGFVGSHVALTAFSNTWPEFIDMLGGYFLSHPYDGVSGPGHLVNEAPDFPATKHFPKEFDFQDEYYIPQLFDRSKMRVLLRMDVSTLPARHAFSRPDNDFPVAWAKMYGKGRVFYSSFGHANDAWDNSYIQRMYMEAIQWATGLVDGDVTPRPVPPNLPGPKTKAVITPSGR